MTLGDRVVVMKDGIIHQVGSAAQIYHSPANRFVAGFLGSPSMNFIEGPLVRDAGALWFDSGAGKLRVPAEFVAQLEPHAGERVVLGVRPELMSDREHAHFGTEDNALHVTVRQVQMLGDCLHVHLSTDQQRLVASVDAYSRLRAREVLPIHLHLSRCLFFAADAEGKRLNDPLVA